MTGVVKIINVWVVFVIVIYTAAQGNIEACSNMDNLAYNKPAYQSSTVRARDTIACAERAVDGNMNAEFYGCNSCMHTHGESNPWWMVDLTQEYYISQVEVTNRLVSGDRFKNVDIETSLEYLPSTGLVDPTLCAHVNSQAGGTTVPYDCNGVLARYVKITLGGIGILNMCEVRVFGKTKYPNQSPEATSPCMNHYSVLKRGRIPSVTPILTERIRSRTACAQKCGFTSGCLAFAVTRHSTLDWECRLYDCNSYDDIEKEDTTYFVKQFRNCQYEEPKS